MSGLLGIGGGIIIVPLLVGILRMPLKRALGTSLLAIVALVIPGTVVHAALGHIDWAIFAALSVGAVPGARIGARWRWARASGRSACWWGRSCWSWPSRTASARSCTCSGTPRMGRRMSTRIRLALTLAILSVAVAVPARAQDASVVLTLERQTPVATPKERAVVTWR